MCYTSLHSNDCWKKHWVCHVFFLHLKVQFHWNSSFKASRLHPDGVKTKKHVGHPKVCPTGWPSLNYISFWDTSQLVFTRLWLVNEYFNCFISSFSCVADQPPWPPQHQNEAVSAIEPLGGTFGSCTCCCCWDLRISLGHVWSKLQGRIGFHKPQMNPRGWFLGKVNSWGVQPSSLGMVVSQLRSAKCI